MTAKIKFNEESKSYYIDGEFNFRPIYNPFKFGEPTMISHIVFDSYLTPEQYSDDKQSELEFLEIVGEKLKKDFINYQMKYLKDIKNK